MTGQTISHYKILEKLGEGGMGSVYKAQDLKLNRFVALKFLPGQLSVAEGDRHRFEHEARAASALDHPNICNVHEIGETLEGQLFIVMAIYDGTPLNKKIEQGPLKLDEALDIALQVAEGLQAAHEKGIVHRDIKSSNIMLTDKGRAVIMDFGLAQSQGMSRLTKTGSTVGTVPYMSPEQARGDKVDNRSDIWSLGVVLYEMVAGHLPFKSEYHDAVVYAILNENPRPLTGLRSGVPMRLEQVVAKAMEKSAGERYQHMDEMLVDLRSAIKGLESGTSGQQPETFQKRVRNRNPVYWGVAAFLVVLIGGGIYLSQVLWKNKAELPLQGEEGQRTTGIKALNSIAVLPFKNISSDKEQEYFCDGMTEQIITNLSNLDGLKVIARTSVMHFKNIDKPVPEIGRLLGVAHVLEGSIRKSGNHIRVTAQLIKTDDGFHLWAKDYDRELKDIFVVQDDVSKAIVAALNLKLSDEQGAALTKRYTANTEAFQLYLRARFHWNKRMEKDVRQSVEFFERAIKLDPTYAQAYAGLADAYAMMGNLAYMRPEDAWPRAKAAALKACELDDQIGEAHSSLGYIKWVYDLDWAGAEKEFKLAIKYDPGYSTVSYWYSAYLFGFLRIDEALKENLRAQQLDPLSVSIATTLGQTYNHARKYDRALDALAKAAELDPNYGIMIMERGIAYLGKGMYAEAIESLQDAVAKKTGGAITPVAMLGYAYAQAGRQKEALKILEQLKQAPKDDYVKPTSIALVCVGLGMHDEAIAWLEKASAEERGVYLTHLKIEPPWDPLQSDPRFGVILKKMGLEK